MKTKVLVVGYCFVAFFALRQDVALAQDSLASAAKSTFLIIYRPGPSWLPGKPISEQPPKGHSTYLVTLFAKGTMKLAGPFTDNAGGAVLLELAHESEARVVAANDPAVMSGVFVAEIHPWSLVDWQERLKSKK